MTFSPTVDERQLKLVHFFPDKIAESATTRFAAKHNLPLPWSIGSVDIALELIHNKLAKGKTR